MIGLAVLELLFCVVSFKDSTGAKHRAENPITPSVAGHSRTKEALMNPITWICAFFLLCYVGVEVSLGGWLVTFMLVVRHGARFASGLVATGFWLGLTFGRVILGFVTGRLGEKIAITAYLLISIGLELCFWLIPNFVASAVFAAWLGCMCIFHSLLPGLTRDILTTNSLPWTSLSGGDRCGYKTFTEEIAVRIIPSSFS